MVRSIGPSTDSSSVVSNSQSWLAGVVAHWDPVKNLDFEFELLYQDTTTDAAARVCATSQPTGSSIRRLRGPLRSHPQLVTASAVDD